MPNPNESTVEAVLRANASFYTAFTHGDINAMSELWAERAPVTCFHPGAGLLQGRTQVLAAWRQIIAGSAPFELRCDQPVVQLLAATTAVVMCYEGNGERAAHLAATNIFVLEDGRWRMVHHQAGPLAQEVPVVTSAKMN
jgi:ketosteroid isomerase-like protein